VRRSFLPLQNFLIGAYSGRRKATKFLIAREEHQSMDQDDLIFLGAAVLLGPMTSRKPPDPTDIQAAVQTARALRDEVNQQHEEARAKKDSELRKI